MDRYHNSGDDRKLLRAGTILEQSYNQRCVFGVLNSFMYPTVLLAEQ